VASSAVPPLEISIFTGIGDLPHFNPDLDVDGQHPGAVRTWRAAIAAADALLISTPEYAHGVPGALKNAFDWLVSGPEFPYLPVALLNTSPRSTIAQRSLMETLRTMTGDVIEPGIWTLPLMGRPLSAGQIVAEPDLAETIRGLLGAMDAAIRRARAESRRLVLR
jgi:NAD(P)H-dependent FMN reductase